MKLRTRILLHGERGALSDQLTALIILLVAGLAAYVAYSFGLPGEFLLDDPVRLPGIQPENAQFTELLKETLQNLHGETGRPVSIFSLALTKATSGPEPGAFKYQNILLHITTGLIQFWAIAYLLGQLHPRHTLQPGGIKPEWTVAACIAGIWLVHPLFASTVLYSVQRIAILGSLFVWVGILCYASGRHAAQRDRILLAASLLFIGAPLSILFGLGSKENAALLPVYFLLINTFMARHQDFPSRGRIICNIANTLLIVIPIGFGIAVFIIQFNDLFSGYNFRPFTLPERILTEGYVLWMYAGMIFVPILRNMTIFHDNHWVATPENLLAYVALAALVALAFIAFQFRNRYPLIGFGILLFLGSHLLESTILPLELIFEHRNYVGMSGLFIAVYGLHQAIKHRVPVRPQLRTTAIAVVLVILGLSSLLALRSWTWSDNRRIIMTSIQEHPTSQRGLTEAANMMLRQQKPLEAFSMLRRATIISPSDAGPYLHMYALKCQGDLSARYEEAAHHAAQHKMMTPYAVNALWNLPGLASNPKCGNLNVMDTLELLRSSLENPSLTARNRYYLQLRVAKVLSNMGKNSEAMIHIKDARRLIPEISIVQRHRAIELEAYIAARAGDSDRFNEVIQYYRALQDQHPYYFAYAHPDFVESLVEQANRLRPGFVDETEGPPGNDRASH